MSRLPLTRHGFLAQIADVVREARTLAGWSQRTLAGRAATSAATVWRIESASATSVDFLVLERVLAALGIRATLDLDARHLADRRTQADGVHARLNGCSGRWLTRDGWRVASEVEVGASAPRGWIDTLAFRESDRSLLVEEVKTEILDVGALQRSLAFYEREAEAAARRLGWQPRRVVVLLVALDTAAVARRIGECRQLLVNAFPASTAITLQWLHDASAPVPEGWTLGVCDPAACRRDWLRPSALESRRHPSYEDYRDAARRLLGAARR